MVRKIGRAVICALVIICIAAISYAETSVDAALSSSEISLDDTVVLTLTFEGNVNNVSMPQLPRLDRLVVISTSQSSQFSWVNGRVSNSKQFQYVLAPQQAGAMTIPPLRFSIDNGVYTTRELPLRVISGGGQSSPAHYRQSRSGAASGESGQPVQGEVFLKATISNPSPYVGEQILYRVKFYRKIRIFGDVTYYPPQFKGFVSYPPDKNKSSVSYQETVDGEEYLVDEVNTVLIPNYQGTISIEPAKVSMQASFFAHAETIKSGAVAVKVKPLPRPAGVSSFSVGEYSFKASVDRTKAGVGDVINAVIEVSGVGSIKDILLPELTLPDDIKKYDTRETIDARVMKGSLQGRKKLDIILIPGVPGTYQLDPVRFTYFSPRQQRYVTTTIDLPSITVEKGNGASAGSGQVSSSFMTSKKAVSSLKSDINYIKMTSDLTGHKELVRSPLFRLGFLALFVVAGINLGYVYLRNLSLMNTGTLRRKSAVKQGYTKLRQAEKRIKSNQAETFYLLIHGALTTSIAERFGISAQGLTKAEIEAKCSELGVPQDVIGDVSTLLDTCDMYRFAGAPDNQDIRIEMLGRAFKVLDDLARYLR